MDVVGISLFFAIVFVLGYFLLRQGKYVDVVVRITDKDVFRPTWYSQASPWYIDAVQVGMMQLDNLGRKTVEVVEKRVYPTGQDSRIADLSLRVKAVYNKRTKQYTYQGQPLVAGSSAEFKLSTLVIQGLIRDVANTVHYPTKRFRLNGYVSPLQNDIASYGWAWSFSGSANTTGVPLYLANAVREGDIVVDSRGKTVATLTTVKKKPAVFILADTQAYAVSDVRNVELWVDVELQAEQINKRPMYLGIYPLVVGYTLSLHFERYTLNVTITDYQNLADSSQ